ncbi:MAG: hypothetical protein FJ395_19460 [Verrucomicrobia bacterium]|nr:hypothetical protein [Verrucomicrobiota bacterium]
MSLLTLEVEIQHGRVVPREPDKVPESGRGLLTILPSSAGALSLLQVLERLQQHLHLDERQAADWAARVQDARR